VDLNKIYNIGPLKKESKTDTIKVVFVRHGLSTWNKSGKFTGWIDVPLSDEGRQESRDAGKALKDLGYTFDVAYTSMLDRATETCDLILEEMGLD
jgi:2,3-bisphosphoglycerate-dependent phosphoglycerate mutase